MLDFIEDEFKTPFVSTAITEYLDRVFDRANLLSYAKSQDNADKMVGYMQGVDDLINHLKMLATQQEGDVVV